jgi:hypothetical protein
MKKILIAVFILSLSQISTATIINFTTTALGSGSFENIYTIENDTLAPIKEFTIWFDAALYSNLQITTKSQLADNWDELILSSTGFGIPVGYDGLATGSGIAISETVSGFSVSYNWIGTGLPGRQSFEIINSITNQTIESGNTVPEPTTLFLLSLSIGFVRKRNK